MQMSPSGFVMSAPYQRLAGLPPYGPLATSFPRAFAQTGREGMVVEFTTRDGQTWIGNFRPGNGGADGLYEHPSGRGVVVVSAGTLYIVDPDDRHADIYLDGVMAVWEYWGDLIVDWAGIAFGRLGPKGFIWRTRRVSWDGFDRTSVEGDRLLGLAWSPLGGPEWVPFVVDLNTGEVEGGNYDGPEIAF